MNKKLLILSGLLFSSITALFAQSKTTEALQKNTDSQAFFFYNNTLRMLNQAEDPEFDALIKDIEKMKFLMVKKTSPSFDYQKLVKDYKAESFEEAMTSRHGGKNFDVYFKTKGDKTEGMLVLVNDSTDLFVLDIVGSIALNQISKLYKTIDGSADIGSKIKQFTDPDHGDKKNDDKRKESDH